jgi:UDP-glucose 4-epimerase
MPKSLITGGAGFLGSHLAEYLLKEGHSVIVLDDLSGGFKENVPYGTDLAVGSILNMSLLENLFRQHQFDYVYHLAAYAAEGLSHFIKHFNYENNLIGSVNLINASINYGVKCFVFTSSMAVYGTNQVPFDESMTPTPEDSYGIAKYSVEQELAISKSMFGLDYVIFRPHNLIGPRQNIGDRYRNVAGIFMNQVMCGQPMTIFGDGNQVRAFSYVGDVIPVIASSPQYPNAICGIYNIGGDQPCTINELVSLIAEAMGVEKYVDYLDGRYEVKIAFSSHNRAREVFGYEPKTDIKEGIFLMAEWAKKHGPIMNRKKFDNIEIEKNIPKFWRAI